MRHKSYRFFIIVSVWNHLQKSFWCSTMKLSIIFTNKWMKWRNDFQNTQTINKTILLWCWLLMDLESSLNTLWYYKLTFKDDWQVLEKQSSIPCGTNSVAGCPAKFGTSEKCWENWELRPPIIMDCILGLSGARFFSLKKTLKTYNFLCLFIWMTYRSS